MTLPHKSKLPIIETLLAIALPTIIAIATKFPINMVFHINQVENINLQNLRMLLNGKDITERQFLESISFTTYPNYSFRSDNFYISIRKEGKSQRKFGGIVAKLKERSNESLNEIKREFFNRVLSQIIISVDSLNTDIFEENFKSFKDMHPKIFHLLFDKTNWGEKNNGKPIWIENDGIYSVTVINYREKEFYLRLANEFQLDLLYKDEININLRGAIFKDYVISPFTVKSQLGGANTGNSAYYLIKLLEMMTFTKPNIIKNMRTDKLISGSERITLNMIYLDLKNTKWGEMTLNSFWEKLAIDFDELSNKFIYLKDVKGEIHPNSGLKYNSLLDYFAYNFNIPKISLRRMRKGKSPFYKYNSDEILIRSDKAINKKQPTEKRRFIKSQTLLTPNGNNYEKMTPNLRGYIDDKVKIMILNIIKSLKDINKRDL